MVQITLFLVFEGKQQNSHQPLPHEPRAGGSPAPSSKVPRCGVLQRAALGGGGAGHPEEAPPGVWLPESCSPTLTPTPRPRTYFGKEAEVAAHTHLDSHRAEKPRNHWVLVTGSPRKDCGTMLDVRPLPEKDTGALEPAAGPGAQ